MAFSVSGLDELIATMDRISQVPDSVKKEMLDAAADVVVRAQRAAAQSMLQGPYYRGAVAAGIAKGTFRVTGDGALRDLVFRGSQEGRPISAIAFYNEYGTSKMPARPFLRTANERSADEAARAAAEIYGQWLDSH